MYVYTPKKVLEFSIIHCEAVFRSLWVNPSLWSLSIFSLLLSKWAVIPPHIRRWRRVRGPQIPCPNVQLKNGYVSITEEGTAIFDCEEGFILMGKDTLTCGESGNWDGYVPNCISKWSIKYKIYANCLLLARKWTVGLLRHKLDFTLDPQELSIDRKVLNTYNHFCSLRCQLWSSSTNPKWWCGLWWHWLQ